MVPATIFMSGIEICCQQMNFPYGSMRVGYEGGIREGYDGGIWGRG